MYGRVAHNAFLSDIFFPGLKLRLDKAEHLPGGFEQLLNGRKHNFQRNKRHIHDRQIKRFSEILRRDITDIRPLHYDHARIRTNLPCKLAITDINGKNLAGSLLKQTVGKSPG